MSKRRRFIFWAFTSIALALILYTSLPRIAEALLKYQLQSAGLHEPVVHIEEIGLQGARIGKLAFDYNRAQYRIGLQSQGIQLTYNFSGLLSGRLDQIVVAKTDITVESKQVAAMPETAADKSFALPSLNDLPFRLIALQHVQLVNKQADKDVTLDITGNIHVGTDQAKAQMKIAQQGQDKVQANLFLLDSGDMRLLVYDPQQDDSLLDLSASKLSMLDNYVKTTLMATMDLEKISGLLEAWGIELAIKGLVGTITARGNVSLPVVGSYTLTEWLHASQIQAEMDINLTAQYWSDLAQEIDANIPMRVNVDGGLIKWDFDKDSQLSLIPIIKGRVGAGILLSKLSDKLRTQKLHVTMPDGFSGEATINADKNAQTINTQQAIYLKYGDRKSVTRIFASMHSPRISMYPSPRLQTKLFFTADSSDTAIAYAGSVHTQGEAGVAFSNEGLELNLHPETMMSANKFIFNDVNMKSLSLKLLSKAVCGYKRQSGEWYCGEFDAGINAPEIGYDQHRVQSAPGSVHVKSFSFENSGWKLKANMDFRDINLNSGNHTIKLDRIRTDIAFNNAAYAMQANMYAAKGDIEAKLEMQHNPVSGKGNINYRLLPVSFKASRSITDLLFDKRSYPLQFDNGTLAVDGQLIWKSPLKKKGSAQPAFKIEQNTKAQITQVSGRFKKTLFRDLNARLQLQGWERFSLKQPVNIRVAEINPGIPVTDISLLANMDYAILGKQAFTISKLSAQTFGGEITGDDIYVDLGRKQNPFKLKLSHLDIARILELEQNQGVYGTGYIDGELPFDFSAEGLSIRDGKLNARAPGGKIQYKANERVTALANSNTSLAMLLQALTDFNYKELGADANYDPDGTLLLKVRLKGANPEFQQGRPVHLNVNVEENVLQLIRSIQLGDEIGEKIGERVLERKQKD